MDILGSNPVALGGMAPTALHTLSCSLSKGPYRISLFLLSDILVDASFKGSIWILSLWQCGGLCVRACLRRRCEEQ